MIKCHLVKAHSYYINGVWKCKGSGTFSHMVTVTAVISVAYGTTALLPSAGDSYRINIKIL